MVDFGPFKPDGTRFNGRSILISVDSQNYIHQLHGILKGELEYNQKSIKRTRLLKGRNISELICLFRLIPRQKYVQKVVDELHKKNSTSAIAFYGYQILTDGLENHLAFQYTFGNKCIIQNKFITGGVSVSNKDIKKNCNEKIHSMHKSNILLQLCNLLEIKPDQTEAVGDGIRDSDMSKNAGVGIA